MRLGFRLYQVTSHLLELMGFYFAWKLLLSSLSLTNSSQYAVSVGRFKYSKMLEVQTFLHNNLLGSCAALICLTCVANSCTSYWKMRGWFCSETATASVRPSQLTATCVIGWPVSMSANTGKSVITCPNLSDWCALSLRMKSRVLYTRNPTKN